MATGRGYQFMIDVDQLLDTPIGTPDYQDICAVSIDEVLNESLDTYFKMCEDGFANNVLTALDPEYTATLKGEDEATNQVLYDLFRIRFDLDKRNRQSLQIIDNYSGETITVPATITAISDTREVETVIEITIGFKFRGAPTVIDTP